MHDLVELGGLSSAFGAWTDFRRSLSIALMLYRIAWIGQPLLFLQWFGILLQALSLSWHMEQRIVCDLLSHIGAGETYPSIQYMYTTAMQNYAGHMTTKESL